MCIVYCAGRIRDKNKLGQKTKENRGEKLKKNEEKTTERVEGSIEKHKKKERKVQWKEEEAQKDSEVKM
jgi:hypothetical protein